MTHIFLYIYVNLGYKSVLDPTGNGENHVSSMAAANIPALPTCTRILMRRIKRSSWSHLLQFDFEERS